MTTSLGSGLRPVRDADAEALVGAVTESGAPTLSQRGVEGARAYIENSVVGGVPGPEVHSVEDREIAADGRVIPVRVYRPVADEGLPLVVYFHGGGFVVGSVTASDAFARRVAVGATCVVVSVDYRLAPEHPFPAAIEDAEVVLGWAAEFAADLGGDPDRLVALGDSAGGTLATVAVRRLIAAGRPVVRRQVLAYPGVAAEREPGGGFGDEWPLTDEESRWFMERYLPDERLRTHVDAAPLLADLTGMPATTLLVGGCDPLCGEGLEYATRLVNAGVQVDLHLYAGQIHGFLTFPDTVLPRSREALGVVTTAIRNA